MPANGDGARARTALGPIVEHDGAVANADDQLLGEPRRLLGHRGPHLGPRDHLFDRSPHLVALQDAIHELVRPRALQRIVDGPVERSARLRALRPSARARDASRATARRLPATSSRGRCRSGGRPRGRSRRRPPRRAGRGKPAPQPVRERTRAGLRPRRDPIGARPRAVSSRPSRQALSACSRSEKYSSAFFVLVSCSPVSSMPFSVRNALVSAATWNASEGAHFVDSSRIIELSG